MRITASRVLIGGQWQQKQALVIEDTTILAVEPCNGTEQQFNGDLVPGFIDVQVNGGGGALFNAKPDKDTLQKMLQAHAFFGTTTMLPTLITDHYSVMKAGADAIAQAIEKGEKGIAGVHFEGPFISKARKGVHPENCIRLPTDQELALFTRQDIGRVMITVAPEHFPVDLIRDLASQGVIVFLGHSAATYEQAQAAVDAGATGFTHLFNAMSPLTSREPGVTGAALANPQTFAGLVLDHFHVHPVTSRIALQQKGAERLMLVTDAMAHVGTDAKQLPFYDTEIVRENDRLTTPDGTLAGSCLDMATAVRHAYRDLQCSLEDAISMASLAPAMCLGMTDRLGSIAPGKLANLVLLDKNVQVQEVFSEGVQVHRS